MTFTGSAEYEVIAAYAYFEEPSIVGDGMVKAIIYDVDSDTQSPGDSIGESVSLMVSALAVPDSFVNATFFPFLETSDARPASEHFFVSIDISQLYASQDTLALFSTNHGCGDGANTWDLVPGGQWFAVGDSANSWNVDLDYLMGAVVEFDDATSTDAFVDNGALRLHPAYPNPSRSEVFLNFSLEDASEVSIQIYDLSGKRWRHFDLGDRSVGRHQYRVDLTHLTPGSYYYRIATDHGQLASRFVME